MLSRLLHKEKQSNSASSSQKITDEMDPITLMKNVSNTLLSINDVKKQINDSRLMMEQKHRDLFIKCVRAQQEKESPFVAVKYAFLCAQTKKIAELVIASQIDLERVVINTGTAKEFYDTAVKLTPIIQKVSEGLAEVIPEVSTRLEQIGETLDNLATNTREVSTQTWITPSLGIEDEKTFVGFGVVNKQLRNDFHSLSSDGLFLHDTKKRM